MPEKPTHASVTATPCTCNYLQNAVADESNPIRFEERAGEFQFRYGNEMLVIYHCPFCGGGAPPTKRGRLFHAISTDERTRLADLVEPFKTIAEAIAALGPPDSESRISSSEDEKEGHPPTVTIARSIRYENLSATANVDIIERPDGTVYATLTGKFAGPQAR